MQRCQNNDCSITITAANHGLANNEYVYITNVGGMTQINDQSHLVGNAYDQQLHHRSDARRR